MRLYKSAGRNQCSQFANILLLLSVMLASFQLLAQARGKEPPVKYPTSYRTIQIDGLPIFYREAGPKDAPTILLNNRFGEASQPIVLPASSQSLFLKMRRRDERLARPGERDAPFSAVYNSRQIRQQMRWVFPLPLCLKLAASGLLSRP